jgi:hypothetical protein|tara:strand:- start:507 stop:668 length:162 start_codon:yes stop_codon:yes gene_type:complete
VISGALAVKNSPSGLTGINGMDAILDLAGTDACLAENLALTVAFTMAGCGFYY